MKNYYRIMLGRKSIHAAECLAQNFIGIDAGIQEDLSGKLADNWRVFNQAYIPVYLKNHPDKTKVAAGLACGALWTVSKGINIGDIVVCPDGTGKYHVGEVTGNYSYHENSILPHRRAVRWLPQAIDRTQMSDELRNSTGSIGTVSNITKHGIEIERFLGVSPLPVQFIANDKTVEDPLAFMMEKHLEDFLVRNWRQTELGHEYDIYQDEDGLAGQQYETDTGPIDILAVSKDKRKLLVIELKRGRASDVVVGQILRYMGYVKETLAEDGQEIHGAIIALEDDVRLQRALAMMVGRIDFYRYQISFKLLKASSPA